jgi:hypothetical protein
MKVRSFSFARRAGLLGRVNPPLFKTVLNRVRLPRSLHRQLAETAEREGISLNLLVNVFLARAVERTNPSVSYPIKTEQSLAVAEKKGKFVAKQK